MLLKMSWGLHTAGCPPWYWYTTFQVGPHHRTVQWHYNISCFVLSPFLNHPCGLPNTEFAFFAATAHLVDTAIELFHYSPKIFFPFSSASSDPSKLYLKLGQEISPGGCFSLVCHTFWVPYLRRASLNSPDSIIQQEAIFKSQEGGWNLAQLMHCSSGLPHQANKQVWALFLPFHRATVASLLLLG